MFTARYRQDTHLFIGSANATDAALVHGSNVEFVAELIGKHRKVGLPENWLNEKGLQSLLVPYVRSLQPDTEASQEERGRLAALHKQLTQWPLCIDCVADGTNWSLHLYGLQGLEPGEVSIGIWPLTLKPERSVAFKRAKKNAPLVIGVVGKQEITSFIGFTLTIGAETLQFGLDIPLRNAPPDRALEILRQALRNRDTFVRYLALLLGEWTPTSGQAREPANKGRKKGDGTSTDGLPLFELLARAYAREPERLTHVAQVVDRLRQEAPSRTDGVIPPGFLTIWRHFEEAMRRKGGQ